MLFLPLLYHINILHASARPVKDRRRWFKASLHKKPQTPCYAVSSFYKPNQAPELAVPIATGPVPCPYDIFPQRHLQQHTCTNPLFCISLVSCTLFIRELRSYHSPNSLLTLLKTLSFSGSYGWSLLGISRREGNAAVYVSTLCLMRSAICILPISSYLYIPIYFSLDFYKAPFSGARRPGVLHSWKESGAIRAGLLTGWQCLCASQ